MNWTGGKLRRHSKANANAVVKAQKQHFAKARAQVQTRRAAVSPLNFSFARCLFDVSNPTEDRSHTRQTRSKCHNQKSPQVSRDGDPNYTCPVESESVSNSPQPRDSSPCQRGYSTGLQEKSRLRERTLEDVQRELLRHPDWVCAAAARPVKIQFVRPEEVEQIGRRRKITSDERKRQRLAQEGWQVRNEMLQPFNRSTREGPSSVSDLVDVSIRMGSNLHPTQSSLPPPHPPKAPKHPQSSSTDLMLLDKFEEPSQKEIVNGGNSCQSSRAWIGVRFVNLNLDSALKSLPLDQVRYLKSFDEVKARSSSLARMTPLTPGMSSTHESQSSSSQQRSNIPNQHAPRSSSGDEATMGERNLKLPTKPSKCSSRSPQADARSYSDLLETGNRRDTWPGTWEGQIAPSKSLLMTSGESARRPNLAPQVNNENKPYQGKREFPTFTLDHQIEQEACREGEPSPCINQPGTTRQSPFYISSDSLQNHVTPTLPRRILPLPFNLESRSNVSKGPEIMEAIEVKSPNNLFLPGGQWPRSDQCYSMSFPQPCAASSPVRDQNLGLSRVADPALLHCSEIHRSTASSPGKSIRQEELSGKPARPNGDIIPVQGNISDENERWMKFVFPDDFERMQRSFQFSSHVSHARFSGYNPNNQIGAKGKTTLADTERRSQRTEVSGSVGSPDNALTSCNTTLFRPQSCISPRNPEKAPPSETDFLTQLSPMEGCLDERLRNLSDHTNPARSVKSFIPASTSISRQGDLSTDHVILDEDTPRDRAGRSKRSAGLAFLDLDSTNLAANPHKKHRVLEPTEMRIPTAKEAQDERLRDNVPNKLSSSTGYCHDPGLVHRGSDSFVSEQSSPSHLKITGFHGAGVFPLHYSPVPNISRKPLAKTLRSPGKLRQVPPESRICDLRQTFPSIESRHCLMENASRSGAPYGADTARMLQSYSPSQHVGGINPDIEWSFPISPAEESLQQNSSSPDNSSRWSTNCALNGFQNSGMDGGGTKQRLWARDPVVVQKDGLDRAQFRKLIDDFKRSF